ncbi:MAG: asparagine synthase (glutamine-hydrolyzing) [Anaerolineales bacterium]|jgi:asparagine synthase (glutamine-hydrolysing)|nr:asparagine synthase (glutamine-hydrolyzing) [Anaerolineaceae bacterium]MDP7345979.1 asparagine synthase (glutamine-hydrolyzing) [Anaerolineales bacterium]MDP7643358.1 asparagine synthase (glutamine-hydrolyzing) [Anaerolineales bacterium]HJL69277.1 asparagine synthase (glutamine-hydrolyzing) [Anaerolineales bacterium]HJN41238.1 asparagine synthase (glutamine-hydrolyzing) [Anaerolineales bacterium]|tara:strand:+ start:1303 stop:3201 length:1899 start_codon:yes stop_codon:yes gene_type:complete
MCGICGIAPRDAELPDADNLAAMQAAIFHRGPDSGGQHVAAGIGLAVRRLSIVDLITGNQPMYSEDRNVVLVYNGEIYNHYALRSELAQRDHRYSSQSDAEIVVHAYEEWGDAAVQRFRGMFAFALWDAPAARLWLVRDRLGQKPLYYVSTPAGLLFASEIKALLRDPTVTLAVDEEARDLYFTVGYVPAPWTMFAGIRKLPPAHHLFWHKGHLAVERYWSPPLALDGRVQDEIALRAELREQLKLAVEERLMSDVPLGAFLSGGVDSSLVVGLMAHALDRPVRTYAIGFDEAAGVHPKFNEDFRHAELVARNFGTDHCSVIMGSSVPVEKLAPRAMAQLDEPIANPTVLATYMVARQARKDGVKVLLSGDGGDELFGGYTRYTADHWVSRYKLFPAVLRKHFFSPLMQFFSASGAKLAVKAELPPTARYLSWYGIFSEMQRADLLPAPAVTDRNALAEEAFGAALAARQEGTFQERLMHTDRQTWLAEESNMRMDMSSMFASVEVRAPFQSHPLVEFAALLPLRYKLRGGTTKVLLKESFTDLLPAEVLRRRKSGFFSPASSWLRGPLRPLAECLLAPDAIAKSQLRGAGMIQSMCASHMDRSGYYLNQLWALLSYQVWYFTYILGDESPL